MVAGADSGLRPNIPVGTAPLVPMSTTPRPLLFSGIGAYITATHYVLVTASLAAPIIAYISGAGFRTATAGIILTVLISAAGGLALFTEAAPDRRVSRFWRRRPVRTLWSILLVVSAAALMTIGPEHAAAFSPAALPVALALRAIATGSVWATSLRILGAGLACFLGISLVHRLTGAETPELALSLTVGTLLALAVVGQDTIYRLAVELDDLRSTEAQRAVTHERQRFAGDLHDIQGQNLQLLAAEAQIVQRLIAAGRYDDASAHAARLGQIAATASDEMREVVHAYRAVSVEEEAANAVRVLESAGISVVSDIDPPTELADPADRLLGLTIREGVTNVLRHTTAGRCRLSVGIQRDRDRRSVHVVLADSGPSSSPVAARGGSGLADLRRRYAEAGGHLTFTTAATGGSRLEGRLPLDHGRAG